MNHKIEDAFTSKKWQWLFYHQDSCPDSLLQHLITQLPHIDPLSWPARFALGGVYINGLPIDNDSKLSAPCKIEYYEPRYAIEQIHEHYPPFSKDWVVYEDEYLLVAFKPAHLSSLPTKDQKEFNLKIYLEKYLGHPIHMPSRLDMSTQGLICISKSEKFHSRLQRLYENRQIKKQYLFRSHIKPDWESKSLDAPIGRSREHGVLRCITPGGKEAKTNFRKIHFNKESQSLYMLAEPLTGRTHQIRVHAAHLGIPVRGDKFYKGAPADLLNLLSYAVRLKHPISAETLNLSVPSNLLPKWLEEGVHEKLISIFEQDIG